MSIDEIIEEKVNQIVDARMQANPAVPELISVDEAAEICSMDKSVILSLVHKKETGFPAAVFGPRTIRIDKIRLFSWIQNGGLNGIHN